MTSTNSASQTDTPTDERLPCGRDARRTEGPWRNTPAGTPDRRTDEPPESLASDTESTGIAVRARRNRQPCALQIADTDANSEDDAEAEARSREWEGRG